VSLGGAEGEAASVKAGEAGFEEFGTAAEILVVSDMPMA
jgi:hypothetical protein